MPDNEIFHQSPCNLQSTQLLEITLKRLLDIQDIVSDILLV